MLKNIKLVKTFAPAVTLSAALLAMLPACSFSDGHTYSRVDTVNLPQTDAKWQSIGNCWIYAVFSWAESIALRDSNGENKLNLSESYITYRYFETQLNKSYVKELNTGGSWYLSRNLINSYGVMHEGDFIPSEADATFSKTQAAALSYLNGSLKNGLLKEDRSPETVRAELDKAFGVKYSEFSEKIVKAKDLVIGKNAMGMPMSLAQAMNSWTEIGFDYDYLNAPQDPSELPKVAETLSVSRKETLKRVKRALNDHQPVVMSWFVDFNALDSKGVFSGERLQEYGSGRQGWHMIVIEDYVVEGIHPVTGEKFEVGEGEATPEMKALAAEFGDIKYFVIKNSWGGNERVDRPSYQRDGVGGYHRLDASYMFSWVANNDAETGEYKYTTSIIGDFVIPYGY